VHLEVKVRLAGRDAGRKLKVLEEENCRLKRLLADAVLDNVVLKAVAGINW